ncbi:MAG TPA: extracellular solute-binding protein [Chloroflexota bacterium]|nr:extracellular solute-binding protein [Chloroflexota bacterium]
MKALTSSLVAVSRRRLLGSVAGAGLAGAAGLAASGCGIGQPSAVSTAPVTVRALLDPSLITLFGETAAVIPTFKSANPHVTLDIEAGPGPSDGNLSMISKFKAKIASGEQLDVYGNAASDTVAGFAKAGLLKDLTAMMAKQRAVQVKDYFPAATGAVTYAGKLYALPFQVFTQLLYYNEDLLKREGQPMPTKDWTWDKLLEVCKAVTRPASGNQPGQWGINMVFTGIRPGGLIFMWDWGGKLFDDDTNPRSLSLDANGAAGWQWMADLFTKHRVVPLAADATNGGFANTSAMVTAGQVAFNFSSLTWRSYRNNTGFKGNVVMLPKGPARQTAATWADCLTMPSVAKSPDAALNLMTHISGPAGQKLMIPVVDQFPSVESIATSPEWLKFDQFNRQQAIDMVKLAKPIPPTPAWPDINTGVLGPLGNEVVAGRKTAMQALQEVKPKIDDLLRTLG